MSTRIVATLPRTDSTQLRVTIAEYRGKPLLDLRLYFLAKNGDWLPTRKGCCFQPDELHDLLAAVEVARKEILGLGGGGANLQRPAM